MGKSGRLQSVCAPGALRNSRGMNVTSSDRDADSSGRDLCLGKSAQ